MSAASPRGNHARIGAAAAVVAAALLVSGSVPAQTPAPFAPAGSGVVRALIVGIDEYDAVPNLKGAAADARDFEATLRRLGVRDLTVLVNRAASRRAVAKAMDEAAGKARDGDLVMLVLAGHGMREPERVKGSNRDGYEKSFLFSGFDRDGPRTQERMLSAEIKAWINGLEQKGVDVLFVADACHGGGLIRQVSPLAGTLSYRTVGEITLQNDALRPLATPADAIRHEADFARLTFLAAADDKTKSPELEIPGVGGLRGALSYTVARAIEGAVDGGQNGLVTRRRLFEYSRQVVYQYSQTRQLIDTAPNAVSGLDVPVFRRNVPAIAQPPHVPVVTASREPVRVRIVNGAGTALAGIEPLHVPFRVVPPGEPAELSWDVGRAEVVSAAGDVVARDIGANDVPGVVDRTGALAAVARLAQSSPQPIVMRPSNAHHRAGQHVWFDVEGTAGKYLVLFSIAGDGTVQHQFPMKKETPLVREPQFKLELDVRKPFGADYVVAIVSDTRLEEVEQALHRLDGKRAAGRVPDILKSVPFAGRTVRLGTAGLFTVP